MGYSIELELNDENVENLTIENFSNEFIINSDVFLNWFDENVDIDEHCDYDEDDKIIELTDDELTSVKIDSVEDFKDSESYFEFSDDYGSVSNTLDILKFEPQKEDFALVEKYCSNISLFYVRELSVYGMSNNGGGMDLSDNYALAYWIIDGYSPIKVSQVMSLSDEAEKLLKWYETRYQNHESVCAFEMKKYLREINS